MTTAYPNQPDSILKTISLTSFLCLSCFSPPVHAQEPELPPSANQMEDLLALSLEQLLQVKIVTAGKTEQKAADIPASVVVITRQDIEMQGWRTLDEVLQNIPGLYAINQYYHEGYALGIRGFWSSWSNRQIMILVDGVNHLDEFRGDYDLASIAVPVAAIEKIEVVRGAMSAIYGSGAAFGVINIITSSSASDKPVQSISVAAGNHNDYQSCLRLTGHEGKFYYTTNLSHYHANRFDAPLAKMVSDSFLQQNQGKFPQTMDGLYANTETFFNFNGNFRDFSVLFSYVETNQQSSLLTPPVENGEQNSRRMTTFGLGYEHQLRDDLKVKMRVHYLANIFVPENDSVSRTAGGGWDVIDNHSLDSELNLFWQPNSKWQVTTGLNHHYLTRSWHYTNIPWISRENQIVGPTDGDHPQSIGLFGQTTYQISDSLQLVAGLRLHQTRAYQAKFTNHTKTPNEVTLQAEYADDKIRIIPRLAAIWQPTKQRVFKLLYGESTIDAPLDLNVPGLFNGSPLKAEHIKTSELVYTENFNWIGLTASLFHNQLENLIVRDIGIDPVTRTDLAVIRNTGRESTTGLEATLQLPVTDKWQVEVSSSYQHTDDLLFNRPAAYSPKWLGYWKTSYRWAKGRSLAVSGRYIGEMLPLYDPVKKNRIGETIDGYVVWDTNLRWEDLLIKGAFLNLRISNLLDQEIRDPTSSNNPWAVKGIVGESRAFWLTLGLKW